MVADPRNFTQLSAIGLRADDWVKTREIFRFIEEYIREYQGRGLSDEMMRRRFDSYFNPGGAFEFWVEAMRKKTLRRRALVVLSNEISSLQNAADPQSAIDSIVTGLSGSGLAGAGHIVPIDASAMAQYDKYWERVQYLKANPDGVIGIPTGFSIFDKDLHRGYESGRLYCFFSRPSVGKSWVMVRAACIAWTMGKRVLIISGEMPTDQLALRCYATFSGFQNVPISHQGLLYGNELYAPAFHALATELEKSNRFWIVDSVEEEPVTVPQVFDMVQRLNPDIVFIDGLMLLGQPNADRLSPGVEVRMKMWQLKNGSVRYGIPIVITHQAVNRMKGNNRAGVSNIAVGRGDDVTMPTLNDAADGEGFARWADVVIAMAPDMNTEIIRWISVRKYRDGPIFSSRYGLYWDVDSGKIADLTPLGADFNAVMAAANDIHAKQGKAALPASLVPRAASKIAPSALLNSVQT